MKMKASVLLILLSFLAFPSLRADRYTDMAQRQLEWLRQGRADSILAHSTAQVKASLPASTVQNLWAGLLMQTGEFRSQKPWRQTPMQGLQVCQSVLVFERASICVQVVLDDNLLLAGLQFLPATAGALEEEPAQADSVAFSERETTIAHGKVSLPATLTLPKGQKGKVPAVLLVAGSGPVDRDGTMGPNRPLRDLAHALAAKGIAVLRYDKRTKVYGAKTAEVSDGGLTYDSEYVEDAVQALRQMAAMEEVDAERLFVIGHSLGGTLAPRIVQRSSVPVRGVIGLAALASPFWETTHRQLRYILQVNGLSEELADRQAREQVERMRKGLPKEYLASQEGYDPLLAADAMGELPVLYVQGGHDYQVTENDLDLWRQAYGENPSAQFRLFPTLDHLMRPQERMAVPADYMKEGRMSEEVIDTIVQFIQAQV